MIQSESIKDLFAKLAKAQGEFTTLPKDKTGYGYKYTDLDTVITAVRPVLAKHDLGFIQSLTFVEGKNGLTTRVFSGSGEYIEDTITLPDVAMAKTNAAQNMGAAITYMKRYALCAMLGISSDEDTDAATPQNSQPQGNTQKTPPRQKPQPKPNAPQFAGGPDTPQENAEIKNLLGATYQDGKLIFAPEEGKRILELRKTKTAAEVIRGLKEQIRVARENITPGFENFPEDIPYEKSPSPAEQQVLEEIF